MMWLRGATAAVRRSLEIEILDGDSVPRHDIQIAHRQLTWVHRRLGDTAALLRALRQPGWHVRRVLDVGCGHGGVLADILEELTVEAVGVDLRPPPPDSVPFPIIQADAVRDPLPGADVAISVSLAHHLSEDELVALIRNVAQGCPRFIIMDLVRHWLPLWLFRLFIAPALPPLSAADGAQSVKRAYTPAEMRRVVERALAGTGGTFRHTVAPFYVRQVVDIRFDVQ